MSYFFPPSKYIDFDIKATFVTIGEGNTIQDLSNEEKEKLKQKKVFIKLYRKRQVALIQSEDSQFSKSLNVYTTMKLSRKSDTIRKPKYATLVIKFNDVNQTRPRPQKIVSPVLRLDTICTELPKNEGDLKTNELLFSLHQLGVKNLNLKLTFTYTIGKHTHLGTKVEAEDIKVPVPEIEEILGKTGEAENIKDIKKKK